MPVGRIVGLLPRFLHGQAASDAPPRIKSLLKAYLAEAKKSSPNRYHAPKVDEVPCGQKILEAPAEDQVLVLRTVLRMIPDTFGGWNSDLLHRDILKQLASRLLRKQLPYRDQDLAHMVRSMTGSGSRVFWLPLSGVLRAVERHLENNPVDQSLRGALEAMRRDLAGSDYADCRKASLRIAHILEAPGEREVLRSSPFRDAVERWLRGDGAGSDGQGGRTALLEHAATAEKQSRPAGKWLKEAGRLVAEVGQEPYAATLQDWLEGLALDPEAPDPNTELIKGLIWAAVAVNGDRIAPPLGRFARRCFIKVPGVGARSVKLGNAAIHVLARLDGTAGLSQLTTLKQRVRYPSARGQIERALNEAAERAGLSAGELEELAVSDFGLGPDGRLREAVGDFEAEVRITGSDSVALAWIGADGKARKTVPAAVKRDHAEALKAVKARVKDIRETLSGQAGRLERLYLGERRWPLETWRRRYLDHPLMSNLSRRLIWRFLEGDREAAGIAEGETMTDRNGDPLDWLGDATEVRLWHPIDESPEAVLAWRLRLEALEITQPFKQAHREVYILTDAERQTETYSNRFAAHIIKQHQFRELCRQRGWRYDLQGAWDSHNVPQRALPTWNLGVQFWVEAVTTDDLTEAYVYLYLATDQVRFVAGSGDAVPLAEVPPLAFSETMRDVDLFVGVASVGNDPNWVDGGPGGHYADYWQSYSFGDLGESAKTRRAVLETLVPSLKIADRCEIRDKFLHVRGSRRTYKIHLGSGNILMEPNDQYLCIVRGWDKATGKERIRLPFEGDATLSLILSKAFMLAADDTITDQSILGQIRR